MQVKHFAAAGAFVQVVYVLGDDLHVEVFLEFGEGVVCGVRLGFNELFA